MKCTIVGANQRDVRVVVAGDIFDLMKAGKPVDVKALSLNMYNAMYDAEQKNNTEALAYARLVPFMVQQLMGVDATILKHVVESKVDLGELANTQIAAQDAETGLKYVEEWLGVRENGLKESLAAAQPKKAKKKTW